MNHSLENDSERIAALSKYDILDSLSEQEYDDIAFLASQICDTPVSTITFIDDKRQWFKSRVGLPHQESPRSTSFCSLALESADPFVNIPDLFQDEAYKKVALVNGLKAGFYASIILFDPQTNTPIGTLCVIDSKPRTLTENQILGLKKLGNQVSNLLKIRLKNKALQVVNTELNIQYDELTQFARVVSHDIKSPLNNIIALSNLLKEEYSSQLDETGVQYLNYISESSDSLKQFVDAVLKYHKSNNEEFLKKESIDLTEVTKAVFKSLNSKNNFELLIEPNLTIVSNAIAIEQILLNLLSNGIKYNKNEQVILEVKLFENDMDYKLTVSDNGMGISEAHFATIFSFCKTLDVKDRFDSYGTGIGLSTVKNIVDKLEGTISIASKISEGTTFTILFKK
ncbi:ATP-binding protein [Flavobacterium antarcticum]|uniref:GAF domain-containing sensor histidine kinase n=1 Tax=Flavobacterium antarcticum TaxID=271155 RepID=UPI0003B65A67|nr:ATP-binding protein [Flavobacterium antarcticum]